jgi:putative SOS response-associated peptidase YedK
MINARSESITREALVPHLRGQAPLPAAGGRLLRSGQKLDEAGKQKLPYYLHASDDPPLAFAGLYSWWKDPELAEDHPDKWGGPARC